MIYCNEYECVWVKWKVWNREMLFNVSIEKQMLQKRRLWQSNIGAICHKRFCEIFQCEMCVSREMTNSLCVYDWSNLVSDKCVKVERVTAEFAMHMRCCDCYWSKNGQNEKLCLGVETVA